MPKKILAAVIIVLVLFFTSIVTARAVVTACDASVDYTSVQPSATYEFRINVVNTSGPEPITWVKITRPSSNFTINSTSSTDWSSTVSPSEITFTGGTIGFTLAYTFIMSVTTGGSEAPSANWQVQASSNADGSSAVTCSGSLGTAISASAPGPDTTAPEISNIVVSDVTDSSVKITWDTSESSNSSVDYGTSDAYGSNKNDGSAVTSHTINLDGLSANTTYHYNVKSTDAAGNTGESGDNTFPTAKTFSISTTSTSTTSTTSSNTSTPTPTPKSPQPTPTGKISQVLGSSVQDSQLTPQEPASQNSKPYESLQQSSLFGIALKAFAGIILLSVTIFMIRYQKTKLRVKQKHHSPKR